VLVVAPYCVPDNTPIPMNESTNHEIAVGSKGEQQEALARHHSDPGNKWGSHDGAQAARRSVREATREGHEGVNTEFSVSSPKRNSQGIVGYVASV